ncbi:hypothetical protein HK100_004115 [Physocladia obscura]|uniref:Uncharacterized protein n=1 Tax=Physocladia obscura TaxID=109957 RepID=A0AAD5XE17_9FUNG|nr:hypothetical protein HK100_004115 [Physocladia obscura]
MDGVLGLAMHIALLVAMMLLWLPVIKRAALLSVLVPVVPLGVKLLIVVYFRSNPAPTALDNFTFYISNGFLLGINLGILSTYYIYAIFGVEMNSLAIEWLLTMMIGIIYKSRQSQHHPLDAERRHLQTILKAKVGDKHVKIIITAWEFYVGVVAGVVVNMVTLLVLYSVFQEGVLGMLFQCELAGQCALGLVSLLLGIMWFIKCNEPTRCSRREQTAIFLGATRGKHLGILSAGFGACIGMFLDLVVVSSACVF